MIGRALKLAADYVPRHAGAAIARRLVARANAARDGRRWALAASLYEEALRFAPGNPRIHIQAGHMFKEAGEFAGAERHYAAAERMLPGDADLALQLGHFYKVAALPDRAEAEYRRALSLRPGWSDVTEELARLGGVVARGSDDALDWAIPELLPNPGVAEEVRVDSIQLRRLGAGRQAGRSDMMRLLRGVEAIRGFVLSAVPLTELVILLDDAEIRRVPLAPFPAEAAAGEQRKYVFNVWHDFASVTPGRYQIELRFLDERGRSKARREQVRIEPPLPEAALPGSDALVDLPDLPGGIEARIAAKPSMVRTVERRLLPDPVHTILVQRVDQLGDLVVSLPAIRRLRALFPGARIIGLLTAANADLGRTLDLFDEIVVAAFAEDPRERRRTMTLDEQARLRSVLRPYAFDIAIDLSEVSDSRPLLLLSGATFLYGFKEREHPWLSAGFEMNSRDPVNAIDHMPPSEKILALVEALGTMRASAARVTPREGLSRGALAPYGIGESVRYVVLHTGARLAYTRWPGFAALAELLLERTDLTIVMLADEGSRATLPPKSERLIVLTGQLPFDDFDALLSFAAAFVGNDSGAKHLAALRGAPVVSLHMARLNWSEWGQEMSGLIVSRRVPCAGCGIGHNGEECGKDFACLTWIRPEEVFDAVLSLLRS